MVSYGLVVPSPTPPVASLLTWHRYHRGRVERNGLRYQTCYIHIPKGLTARCLPEGQLCHHPVFSPRRRIKCVRRSSIHLYRLSMHALLRLGHLAIRPKVEHLTELCAECDCWLSLYIMRRRSLPLRHVSSQVAFWKERR